MKSFPWLAPVFAVFFGLVFLAFVNDPGSDSRSTAGSDTGAQATEVAPETTEPVTVYGGIPVALNGTSKFVVLDNEAFDTGWSQKRSCPLWTAYRVQGKKRPGKLKRPGKFSTDKRARPAVTHRHYTHSGYDRGHMAPNHAIATRFGRTAQLETFRMTNVCPQTPNLNRGVWKKIEGMVAKRWSSR